MMKLNIAIVEDKILCSQWYDICYLFKSPDGKLNGMQQLMSQPPFQTGFPTWHILRMALSSTFAQMTMDTKYALW